MIAHEKKLQRTIQNQSIIDKGFQLHVERFIKGSITSAHARQLSERDLQITRKEAVSKATRKRLNGNVAQKGGVISVGDVRRKAVERVETEVEKAERTLLRTQGRAEQKEAALNQKFKTL